MIRIISATSLNGVIGNRGNLVYHNPEDLKLFKRITKGSIVVMGRKTFESLPSSYKPLPDRKNVIVTRDLVVGYKLQQQYPELVIKHSLNFLKQSELSGFDIYIIGGSEIYEQCLPYAHEILLSEFFTVEKGDSYFPNFDKGSYTITEQIEYSDFTFNR